MSDKPQDDKYRGPGRLASAIGDSALYQAGGFLAGAAGTAGVAHMVLKPDGRVVGAVGEVLTETARSAGVIADNIHINGKPLVIIGAALAGAAVVANIGGIYGLFHGWGKAEKGKRQFESVKQERDLAEAQLRVLKQSNGYAGAIREQQAAAQNREAAL